MSLKYEHREYHKGSLEHTRLQKVIYLEQKKTQRSKTTKKLVIIHFLHGFSGAIKK